MRRGLHPGLDRPPARRHGRGRAPGRPTEVAAVLTACADHGHAVVPQGGNTGLVGGSIAFDGAASRCRPRDWSASEPVDELTAMVSVGAGDTLAAAAGRGTRRRPRVRRGSRGARLRHHRRHDRDERGRAPCHPPRSHARAARRRQGGAQQRRGRSATSGASSRTTPATTGRRSCAAARARSRSSPRRSCSSWRAPSDVAVALFAFATADDAVSRGIATFAVTSSTSTPSSWSLHAGVELVCDSLDIAPPFARAGTVRAARRRRGRPRRRRPARRRRPLRSTVCSTARSRSIPSRAPRCGATARRTPSRSPGSVPCTSSTSRCPLPALAEFLDDGARRGDRAAARGRGVAVRARRRRQHPRQRHGRRRPTTTPSTRSCSSWSPSEAAASAPSTASAGRSCRTSR